MSSENRSLSRSRALKTAQIVHAVNGVYYDCVITDLNSRGARVRFDKAEILEKRVEILIKPEGVKKMGNIVWKRDGEFGVKFDKPAGWLEKHDVPLTNS